MDKVEKAKASQVTNLEEKTGKTIGEWIELAKASGKEKHGEIVSYLKSKQGLTHGYANMIALKVKKTETNTGTEKSDLIEIQYKGKEQIRPLYDYVVTVLKEFGSDIEIAPKMAYSSLRRKKQFAILQPSKIRLDIGLNLKEINPKGRLEPSGSFNAMCTHRIKIETKDQIDEEVLNYLKKAYDQA